ncbi:MAG: hypothetical protein K2N18_03690 [Clostridia bacterium]|nr:hypothetical protein [Clostridia bacterium]
MKIAVTVVSYIVIALSFAYYLLKLELRKSLASKGVTEVHKDNRVAFAACGGACLLLTFFTVDAYLHLLKGQTDVLYLVLAIVCVLFALCGIPNVRYSITLRDEKIIYNNGFVKRSYEVKDIKQIGIGYSGFSIVINTKPINVGAEPYYKSSNEFRAILEEKINPTK